MKLVNFVYLGTIIVSFIGMAIIDWRYRLAWFADREATIKTVAASFVFFFIWDLIGIRLGIFFLGTSAYKTGWQLFPEFPIEEFGFLMFFSYLTLVIWRLLEKEYNK